MPRQTTKKPLLNSDDLVSAWGPRLRQLRLAQGLTLEELAERAGCTKGYLSGIENSKRDIPGDEIVALLEKALKVPAGELARAAGWEKTPSHVRREVMRLAAREASQREREKKLATLLRGSTLDESGRLRGALDEAYRSGDLHRMAGVSPTPTPTPAHPTSDIPLPASLARFLPKEVPLINKISAGYPTEFTDLSYPARIADEYVRAPDIEDPDAFAARVIGDSMLPDYREGDIVVFSPAREVKSGMDCFARLEPDGETTFKRVYFEEKTKDSPQSHRDTEGNQEQKLVREELRGETMIRLQPLNGAYAAKVLDREMVAGLYAAVSVIKKLL